MLERRLGQREWVQRDVAVDCDDLEPESGHPGLGTWRIRGARDEVLRRSWWRAPTASERGKPVTASPRPSSWRSPLLTVSMDIRFIG